MAEQRSGNKISTISREKEIRSSRHLKLWKSERNQVTALSVQTIWFLYLGWPFFLERKHADQKPQPKTRLKKEKRKKEKKRQSFRRQHADQHLMTTERRTIQRTEQNFQNKQVDKEINNSQKKNNKTQHWILLLDSKHASQQQQIPNPELTSISGRHIYITTRNPQPWTN